MTAFVPGHFYVSTRPVLYSFALVISTVQGTRFAGREQVFALVLTCEGWRPLWWTSSGRYWTEVGR